MASSEKLTVLMRFSTSVIGAYTHCVTNLSCTAALSSPLRLPLLLGSRTRTKLSGNMPVRPLAFNVPCHQPPGICLMRCMMAPLCRSSSSGSFAAYSYSTIAQIAAKRGRERERVRCSKREDSKRAIWSWLVSQWGNLIWDTRIYNDIVQVQIFTIAQSPVPQSHSPTVVPLAWPDVSINRFSSLRFATWHSHFGLFLKCLKSKSYMTRSLSPFLARWPHSKWGMGGTEGRENHWFEYYSGRGRRGHLSTRR